MTELMELYNMVISGHVVTREEAASLIDMPIDELTEAADNIRKHFCGNKFDLCTIINGKSGKCPENCKFCAQSAFYDTNIREFPLVDEDTIVNAAVYNAKKGVKRFSIVTSGRRLSKDEINQICNDIKKIKESCNISVCGSFGLLDDDDFNALKKAGVERIHNNLETSAGYFDNVCTTHKYSDKINAILAARDAGLDICSGGIMGLGESFMDRIDMVIELRNLGIKSIPVNMLNPIKGTPLFENQKLTNDEMCRTVAIFRFLIPDGFIRLAGGRGLLPDKGKRCFMSGANAAITGDMLTTSGISVDTDLELLKKLGYEI